jgi:hypothetical protein
MEAVLFIGIQAAGKSTFYRQRFADTHIRLQLPSREEGFDALYYVTLGTMGVFHVREWTTSAGEVRMPTATR